MMVVNMFQSRSNIPVLMFKSPFPKLVDKIKEITEPLTHCLWTLECPLIKSRGQRSAKGTSITIKLWRDINMIWRICRTITRPSYETHTWLMYALGSGSDTCCRLYVNFEYGISCKTWKTPHRKHKQKTQYNVVKWWRSCHTGLGNNKYCR